VTGVPARASAGAPLVAVTAGWMEGPAEHPGRRVWLEQGYLEGVRAAGAHPVLVGPGLGPDDVDARMARCSGLFLTGGEDVDPALYGEAVAGALDPSPERDAVEVRALDAALAAGLPVLAICRGFQLLNVHLGGSLWQDLPTQRPGAVDHERIAADVARPVHALRVEEGSLLAEVLGATTFRTNSTHHQGLRAPGHGLVPVAWAEDGLVEAVELRAWNADVVLPVAAGSAAPDGSAGPGGVPPVLAVQWHPERRLGDPEGGSRRLFEWFGRAVRR
jgi:putative glutamine amidotransferase